MFGRSWIYHFILLGGSQEENFTIGVGMLFLRYNALFVRCKALFLNTKKNVSRILGKE